MARGGAYIFIRINIYKYCLSFLFKYHTSLSYEYIFKNLSTHIIHHYYIDTHLTDYYEPPSKQEILHSVNKK